MPGSAMDGGHKTRPVKPFHSAVLRCKLAELSLKDFYFMLDWDIYHVLQYCFANFLMQTPAFERAHHADMTILEAIRYGERVR